MEQPAVKPVRLSGVDVCFPHEPYGVQKVFMAQVVRAVDHEENALLEAPTGCGKTLSLLCGALAWQTAGKAKKAAAEKAAAERAAAQQPAAEKAAKAAKHDRIEDTQDEAAGAATSPSSGSAGAAKAAADEPPEEPIVVPKIYYATRTHSQIAQVVRELKRTIYKPRMAVLGARPHYCINSAVIRKGNIDAECEELLKDGMGCKYKKNANSIGHGHVKVHDIEDLAKIGKRHTACPYFVARHLADTADLVFCPYSYLLDPNIRRSTRINASDAILIFDEAHNIEDQAREAGTMEVELEQLKGSVMSLVMAANSSAEGDTYRELSDAMLQLINWMLALADGNGAGGAPGQGFKSAGFESFERIWTGQQMLSALSAAGLGAQEVEHLWACYEKAKAAEEKAGFATEGEAALEPVPADVKTPRAGGNALGCVASLLSVLRLMYGTYTEAPSAPPAGAAGGPGTSGGTAAAAAAAAAAGVLPGAGGGSGGKMVQSVPGVDHVADYRLAVQMWLPRDTNHNNRGRRDRRRPDPSTDGFAETTGVATTSWAFRFCLWCLNPGVVFRSLSHVARSVLLTSGTLSPLDSFSGELGLDFHVRLEAPHVVDVNRQVFSRVVSTGLDGRRLRATYKEADQLEYQDSLGKLLLATAATVPDGLLLFLPSYALMEKLSKRWQDTGLMAQLQRVKTVFSEPRAAGDAFDAAIRRYYEAVDGGQGGLFMAVCRGKVSEGIDFADGRARCVMVVGIPYPHAKDSKVALKKDYNNASAAAAARLSMGGGPGRQQQYSGSRGVGGGGPPKVLTGDAWYSQQAFRALNQAIGRCIRHRLDYGAILLVDERFKEHRNQASLSKWVRGAIQPAATTQGLLQDMGAFFAGLAACPPGSAAAAAAAAAAALPPALPVHLQQQPQQHLVKPGCEQQQPAGEEQLVKPGFESGPPMQGRGPCFSKPGFEAVPGMAGCAGGAGPEQGCCGGGSDACSKPGFEPYAAAGCQDADPRSRWQQTPQLVPGGKQPRQQQQQQQQAMPPQQQQQQHKPKLEAPQPGPGRGYGPMDAFLVKAGAKQGQQKQQLAEVAVKQERLQSGPSMQPQQQQQQQQQQVGVAVKQEQLQAGCSIQPQQQQQQQSGQQGMPAVRHQGGHGMWPPPAGQQQQQHSGVKQQLPRLNVHHQQQQSQAQQQGRGQAVSCLTALQGMQLPSPHAPGPPQQHAWGQQQHQHQQRPGHQGPQQHPPLQPLDCNLPTTPAAGSASKGQQAAGSAGKAPPPAARTGVAVSPQQQQQQQAAGQLAGGGSALTSAAQHSEATAAQTPAVVAAAAAAAAAAGEGSSVPDLQQCASRLGLSLPQVQQWLAADMANMMRCLQHQQAASAAAGMQLQQLCCFGLMASFDKALEACQQQQQPPHQPGSDAASRGGSSLATFWRQWHSYVPTGLLAAAAAAGQQQPDAVVAQADRGQWQGPWLQTMQQQELQHNLTAMAGLYDQLMEQQQQQAVQHQVTGSDAQQPPGQLPQYRQQQPPQWKQPPPQQWSHQQQWNQQPQQPSPQQPPPWNQQQQHQRAQQPPGMPPPSIRPPPRSLPASMRPQQQPPTGGGGGGAGSVQGPVQPPPQQQQQRPQLKLQLSQSVKQPKRAAVLSATAQKAIQKRSKAAAGQAVARLPPPGEESSEDDDEFL